MKEELTNDEAGRLRASDGGGTFDYDGDGIKTKSLTEAGHVLLLRSCVLGQTLAEISITDGTRSNGFVYADGELIATQALNVIYWQHKDPSLRSTRTTDANQNQVGRDELDPNGVKVDVLGANHYSAGSGGHNLDPGGGAARAASLMDIKSCDFGGMLVPCSMAASFQEHISSLDQVGQDQWNSTTSWTFTVTATFGDGRIMSRQFQQLGGLFDHTSGIVSYEDHDLLPEDFELYAEAMASEMHWDTDGPQNARVPLSGDNLNQYHSERDRLRKLLRDKNSDCAKFLRSQLGLSGSRIARTVLSQRPFDATASTLTMGAAGLQPRNGLVSDFAVNDYFQQAGANSGTAVYARASQGATPRDVYYTPAGISAPVILHESLHIFLGPNLNDPELATRLGATQAEFEGEGSQVISRILAEHGCQ